MSILRSMQGDAIFPFVFAAVAVIFLAALLKKLLDMNRKRYGRGDDEKADGDAPGGSPSEEKAGTAADGGSSADADEAGPAGAEEDTEESAGDGGVSDDAGESEEKD
ncbi:MAG: hypothetical protein ACI4LM_05655 [Anaerovoracaceae bacterium]